MQKDLWQYPNCGNLFVTAKMWHSCGTYSIEELFARSEPHVFGLYEKFVALVQEVCGEVRVIPQKTRVAIQARIRFTGCVPRKSYLLCSFLLMHKLENPRFRKVEFIPPIYHEHYVQVRSKSDFDDAFRAWIGEAHVVGLQGHLRKEK